MNRLTLLSLFWLTLSSIVDAATIDFNRDIRPILSEKCYFCHGPDENHREADLRLDTSEGAMHSIQSGEFLDRIHATDPDIVMPKPASKLSLTSVEKEKLEAWIKQGATYAKHWAFEPLPLSVDIPPVADSSWIKNPIDRFIAAEHSALGLKRNNEAEPWRWLRRATLDLTGLPPTTDEVDRFLAELAVSSDKEQVYRAAVERILAREAYGEHMAAMWLDAARYADSYGYQSDKLNTQWPYRDWVVDAFNKNLSYDQFLTWQLAGDLLPTPTREQRLATAFNRIHRLNNEGGAVFEEWRQENVADRVHTFGTAILGLTMECCRCHDHKYDPVTARDYYALSAFFNSIDENGLYDRTEKVPSPSMLLPTPDQDREYAAKSLAVKDKERELVTAIDAAKSRWEKFKTSRLSGQTQPNLTIPDLLVHLDFDKPWSKEDSKVYQTTTLDRSAADALPIETVRDSTLSYSNSDSHERQAIRFDGERGITVYNVPPFDRWTPFSVVLNLRETKRKPVPVVVAHHTRGTDAGYNGWDLMLDNGFLESRLYRVWPGNAIGVRTVEPIPFDQWQQVTATYNASAKADGLKLYLNGVQLTTHVLRDQAIKQANVKVDHGGQLVLGQRFRDRGFEGGLLDDARIYQRALVGAELRALMTGSPVEPDFEYFVSSLDETVRAARSAFHESMQILVNAEEAMDEIPVMDELPTPLPAYVLARGEYDAPKTDENRVERGIPQSLGIPFPIDAPKNRLGLAKWATDPRHPLTSRAIVNRLWANFFGAGIVRTPENLGLTGEQPTHPSLLDWLARDFMDHQWDIKRFCQQIVLSATYRQDSKATQDLLNRDPENRWLARGPSHRLSAEQIRDLALAASSLLSPERGGPPVSPYQAGGDLWRENNTMSPPYQQSVGKALYRRSLYSVWKRTAPLPNMMAFDTNSREVCTVKRQRTNTPMQALVLLNDVQFVEAARFLAERLLLPRETLEDKSSEIFDKASSTVSASADTSETEDIKRIDQAFASFTSRPPKPFERDKLIKLLQEERDYYTSEPSDAEKLIKVGEYKSRVEEIAGNKGWELPRATAEIAALTNTITAIMNLDATIWSR